MMDLNKKKKKYERTTFLWKNFCTYKLKFSVHIYYYSLYFFYGINKNNFSFFYLSTILNYEMFFNFLFSFRNFYFGIFFFASFARQNLLFKFL